MSVTLVGASLIACERAPSVDAPPVEPTPVVSTRLDVGSTRAPADASDECRACDGLTRVGDSWAYEQEFRPATKLGLEDDDTRVDVFTVDGARCCPLRSHRLAPGWRVVRADDARALLIVEGHDARWAAFASSGLHALSLTTGAREPIAERVLAELPCREGQERAAPVAVVTRSPRVDDDDFTSGRFALEVVELAPADPRAPPRRYPVASGEHLARYYADLHGDAAALMRRELAWSEDCATLRYTAGPRARARGARFELGRARVESP